MAIDNFPLVVNAIYDATTPRIPNCSRPLKEGIKTNTLIFVADSSFEQRRKKGEPKRTFEISYTVLKKNEYFTIRDFFLKVTNCLPFYWIHPIEKVTYLVRFDQDIFTADNIGHGPSGPTYTLQCKLLQVSA